MRKVIVFPGSRVITSDGDVVTVATIVGGRVYAYARDGWLKIVDVRGDAWGGEADQEVMNEA